MASSRNKEREEERRFNMRTLAIASAASATAAVVTSQLWIHGTWIAAAMTPVLVTLISELLHRPTERIAERITADRPALRPKRAEPSEPGTPAPSKTPTEPAPPAPAEPGAGPIRVYRSSAVSPRRRKIAVGAVLGTSALALLIAVVVLTVPELVAGGAIGGGDKRTTLFRGDRDRKTSDKDEQQAPSREQTEQQPTERTTEAPFEEETTTEAPTTTTTPTTEAPTATQPAPQTAPQEPP
jgi:hypothetical protein